MAYAMSRTPPSVSSDAVRDDRENGHRVEPHVTRSGTYSAFEIPLDEDSGNKERHRDTLDSTSVRDTNRSTEVLAKDKSSKMNTISKVSRAVDTVLESKGQIDFDDKISKVWTRI